jgi:uncharacterized protein YbjT (DUF2867 family)
MRITIFAATGGIGREAVRQALTAGHEVTAVVRDPTRLPPGPLAVQADLAHPDTAALEGAVAEANAVLSCLGPRSGAEVGIASAGTRAIVQAMQAAGARRLVVISAAPVGTVPSPDRPNPPKHDPGDGFFMRHLLGPVVKAAFRRAYDDLAEMEDAVRDSGLDWTIIRPPRLTGGPLTGAYRTESGRNVRRGLFISRANVAHLMLRVLDRPETVKDVIGIAS